MDFRERFWYICLGYDILALAMSQYPFYQCPTAYVNPLCLKNVKSDCWNRSNLLGVIKHNKVLLGICCLVFWIEYTMLCWWKEDTFIFPSHKNSINVKSQLKNMPSKRLPIWMYEKYYNKKLPVSSVYCKAFSICMSMRAFVWKNCSTNFELG